MKPLGLNSYDCYYDPEFYLWNNVSHVHILITSPSIILDFMMSSSYLLHYVARVSLFPAAYLVQSALNNLREKGYGVVFLENEKFVVAYMNRTHMSHFESKFL